MGSTVTPTFARANLYSIIKEVNRQQIEIDIVPKSGTGGVTMIPMDYWRSIKETLFLEQTGVLDAVRERQSDASGFTDVDDIDWDSL